tara:strand:- start:2037 stop:3686 length:1650 start_codon:yes stop_codon:yes gene_type:complete
MNSHRLFALSLIFSTALLAACGGGGGGNNDPIFPAPVDPEPGNPTLADADNDTIPDATDNCVNDPNTDQADADVNGEGDACDPMPTTYAFENADGASTVSYTGQTARQVLINDLVDALNSLERNAANVPADVASDLDFYICLDPDIRDASYPPTFELSDGELMIANSDMTGSALIVPADISSGKDICSKIAGVDKADHILGGEFFGASAASPLAQVNEWVEAVSVESADTSDTIIVAGGTANIGAPTVSQEGLNYRQLIQKFLLGALTLSQGTTDYMSIDFGSDDNLTLAEGKTYTEGAHDFDEAFGYFGPARDFGSKSNADNKSPGYSDTVVVDGLIDVRSELNFGNSVNCAKRDVGSEGNPNPTNFTQEAFNAFIIGRQILQNAAEGATESSPGSLSAEAQTALAAQIVIAAQTWEKCVAATVVHYINDIEDDMDGFAGDEFAELDNFTNLSKHWGEMKGFALGLQFSRYSPFRDGSVAGINVDSLKSVLAAMGPAPVLADGTQNGVIFNGAASAAEAKADYRAGLLTARDTLRDAYKFDATNAETW